MAKPKGYLLQVDGIQAHVLMSNSKPVDKKTIAALAALAKAAHKHVKKEVHHG